MKASITIYVWYFVSLFVAPCLGDIVETVAELPGQGFDFVVIGGGTAGNVIANRLTENPKYSVLVLEAGGSHENILEVAVPLFCTRLTPKTSYDWNFTTVPQIGLNGRALSYSRGRILGGSSSVNFMGYTRGTSDDYDRYARMTNDEGWSWDNLQPYFRKNERWAPPADHHNITGQFNSSVHEFKGINSVSLPGFSHAIDRRVIQTTRELPFEFPYNLDVNSGNHLGVGWTQSTIHNGEMSSSATSYLGPQFIRRHNLHVLLHAQALSILQTGLDHRRPVFRAVEFSKSVGGPRYRMTAKKEIILSAGTIGTPHILLYSGIGDSNTLSLLGIKPLLPSVGRNLSDHPTVGNQWMVIGNDTFDNIGRNPTLAAEVLKQWNETRTGVLVDGTFNHVGWLRLPSNASIFQKFLDPSAGPHTAHIELLPTNGITRPPFPETGTFLGVGVVVLSPLSRGSVTINSSNPYDPPLIDLSLLASDFDMFVMREGIRSARRFIGAPAWSDYIVSRVDNATTDSELDQHIRSNAGTIFHAVGTAAMSPRGANYGVVDPDLRVKGAVGIRIADASVLPVVPAGHTQAATYVFAERAADLIKENW